MRLRFASIAILALLASCASSSMVTQKANPDYVGKPFKSVMVVGVTADEIVRRTFEDRVVALLGKRGIKGVPGYSMLAKRGRVEEAELRQAVAQSGVDGVLITRVVSVDRSSANVPDVQVAMGYGWVGAYGWYAGAWQTVNIPAQSSSGQAWTGSETRLFDAKSGVLAWTGIVETRESDDLKAALTRYVDVIFQAMVGDRVI